MPSKRIIPINIKVYLLTKHCFKYYLWVTFISNCILNICELIVSFFYIYEKRIYGWFKVYKLIGLYKGEYIKIIYHNYAAFGIQIKRGGHKFITFEHSQKSQNQVFI